MDVAVEKINESLTTQEVLPALGGADFCVDQWISIAHWSPDIRRVTISHVGTSRGARRKQIVDSSTLQHVEAYTMRSLAHIVEKD